MEWNEFNQFKGRMGCAFQSEVWKFSAVRLSLCSLQVSSQQRGGDGRGEGAGLCAASCCFLRQETLFHIVTPYSGV